MTPIVSGAGRRRARGAVRLALIGGLVVAASVACQPVVLPPVTTGDHPHVPAGWFRGANLADWDATIDGTPKADKALDDLVAMGGNAVFLDVFWWQADRTATTVAADPARTPTDAALAHAVAAAKARGLTVGIKLGVNSNDGTWSAVLQPSDPAAWLASYRVAVDHYADLGAQLGADSLVIGTELDSLAGGSNAAVAWRSVVADARSRFGGSIYYAASQSGFRTVQWYDVLDAITLEGYQPLSLAGQPDPGVSGLVAAWSSFTDGRGAVHHYIDEIAQVQASFGKPVFFTEMGYSSSAGSTAAPAKWAAPVDLAAQADAYEAFFEAWHGVPWFTGGYWWGFTAHDVSWIDDNKLDVRGKPAEDVITAWWGGPGHSGPHLVHPALPAGPLDAGFYDLGPWGAVNPTDAHLELWSSRQGVTFECRDTFATPAWSPCTSPIDLHGLPPGQTSLQVRAVDPASGAVSAPANRTWTVG